MTSRDPMTIVMAEDDVVESLNMQTKLERDGGYTVHVTSKAYEIVRLIDVTNAGLALLDLELDEKQTSIDIIPTIRERFGKDILIVILTGEWERWTENRMYRMGIDLMLRKPYPLSGLVMTLAALQDRKGAAPVKSACNVLKTEKGQYEIEVRTFRIDGKTQHPNQMQGDLVRLLAASRNEQGWLPVRKSEIMDRLFGPDADDTEDARFRKAVQRIRAMMGDKTIITIRQHPVSYKLGEEVELVK